MVLATNEEHGIEVYKSSSDTLLLWVEECPVAELDPNHLNTDVFSSPVEMALDEAVGELETTTYLRGEDGSYGFKIPYDAPHMVVDAYAFEYIVHFNERDNVVDMDTVSNDYDDFDSAVCVDEIETITE